MYFLIQESQFVSYKKRNSSRQLLSPYRRVQPFRLPHPDKPPIKSVLFRVGSDFRREIYLPDPRLKQQTCDYPIKRALHPLSI
jgi:hypothetical protein